MQNLGAMAYSRYTGFREITDRDVLELHCSKTVLWGNQKSDYYMEVAVVERWTSVEVSLSANSVNLDQTASPE